MTTSIKLPQLQVLDREGSIMLAKVAGTDNAVAVVDDQVLNQLLVECRNAKAGALKTGEHASSVLDLCMSLESALKPYMKIRNDYFDRIDIERERAEAELKLQEAINGIENSPPQ
jgi:hypothetical protein